MASVHPYLHFSGRAEEAFNFYKSAFGTEFTVFQRYSDIPSGGQEDSANRVLHVSLPIGGGTMILGGDVPASYPDVSGNNTFVSVSAETEEEAKHLYETLSAGGTVMMPLEKTFFAPLFCMFRDRFGTQWMVTLDN